MKPLCSLCKVVLIEGSQDSESECPNCHAIYYLDKEIIEYEDDDFCSSHSDELPELGGIDSGPGIMAATEEEDPSLLDELYKKPRNVPNRGENASQLDCDY